MKPMGRPKSDNPKSTQITVRLDRETLGMLDQNAEHYRESRVDSIRRGIEMLFRTIKK